MQTLLLKKLLALVISETRYILINRQSSLDTPLPLNRDGKGLGTQAVKTCTRSIKKVQISRDVAATAHDNCVTSGHTYHNLPSKNASILAILFLFVNMHHVEQGGANKWNNFAK